MLNNNQLGDNNFPQDFHGNNIHSIMVFAAGFGKRMSPLTKTTPKPLVQVKNKTLLEYNLALAINSGLVNIVVNTHYLPEQINEFVNSNFVSHHFNDNDKYKIELIHEPEILETGGGIVNALHLLTGEAFFSVNSDTILVDNQANPIIKQMQEFWQSNKMDGLLLLQPIEKSVGYDGTGDFQLDKDNKICKVTDDSAPKYVFTGLQILKKQLFTDITPHKFSLRDIYLKNLENQAENRLYGLVNQGDWLHIGTPESIKLAEDYFDKA
ncbi:MAG: nucleotidyltransferase family protein [Pseudomonadota bacterium]